MKYIAFYLTQFHPTPENDEWWGKGFTEWTNVTKAKPLFEGHYQPHLPTDMGFYDLRLRQSRHAQIDLAKAYGIDGFCYHYYWFSGRRLLHEPLLDMLADRNSNMPFCLCWANENWTRRWDGAAHQLLVEQKHMPDDPARFIDDIAAFWADPRYICHEGRPLLIVYCAQQLPNPQATFQQWRQACDKKGIARPFIVAALTHGHQDHAAFGADAGIDFPPHNLQPGNINDNIAFHEAFSGNVKSYEQAASQYLARIATQPDVIKTVFPSWDNTARTAHRAMVIADATPHNYEQWLHRTVQAAQQHSGIAGQLVFINAWNEWAEGCHLEPDRKHGRGFLEATLRVKQGRSSTQAFTTEQAATTHQVIGFWRDSALLLQRHLYRWLGPLKLWINQNPRRRRLALSVLRFLRKYAAVRPD
jgi:lipopolysaccharide biosynthesis protein